MLLADFSSFFIKDQALFGSYPTQEQIYLLEEWGVDLIINLTNPVEKKISKYITNVKTINFSIRDRSIPNNKQLFCALIIQLCDELNKNKKIFIHCKAGHGRAGLLVASILCYRMNLHPKEAIEFTTEFHSLRNNLKSYWKLCGSPQTSKQKYFIYNIFQDHTLTDLSPLCSIEKNTIFFSFFLLQTFLGKIVGENGDIYMKLRNDLFRTKFKFQHK